MKEVSFNEILREKMQEKTPATEPLVTPQSKITFEFSEPLFFISPEKIKTKPLKSYPQSSKKLKIPPPEVAPVVVAPPPPPPEKWILKVELDADGQSKWNLFEKTIGMVFGDKITKPAARSAFRKFIKGIHPDLNDDKKTYNFATLVKIRDEFMKVLDKIPN